MKKYTIVTTDYNSLIISIYPNDMSKEEIIQYEIDNFNTKNVSQTYFEVNEMIIENMFITDIKEYDFTNEVGIDMDIKLINCVDLR